MRDFSFAISRSANLVPLGGRSQEAASPPPYEVENSLRRRLEDAVEDVFRAALKRGDLGSAEDLLGVMESMHARARVRFKPDRKGTPLMIERSRNELEARKARRHPGTG
jgi:hypothetical protein